MPKPERAWSVTPHAPLEKLDDNLWALSSDVPAVPKMPRRMTIVKLSDGKLLFFNAVPMDEATMAEIKAWGTPAYLIAPHKAHMIDADAFRKKFDIPVFVPRIDTVAKARMPGAKDCEDLPKDSACEWMTVPGTKLAEPALLVTSPDGKRKSFVVADALANMRSNQLALLYRILGFAGAAPKTAPVFKMLFVGDKAGLRSFFEKIAATPGLVRIVPSHGDVVVEDAAGALRAAAAAI